MGWSGGTYTRSDGVFTGTSIWQSNRDAGTKIVAQTRYPRPRFSNRY